jgi:arsenate reductase
MSAIIYHNPRCSKSRLTLDILKEKAADFEIIHYLDSPPNNDELKALIKALNIDARGLMRRCEAIYKEHNLDDKTLSEADLIQAMIDNPILIERPIVKTDKGVVIGRPPENVLRII